MKIAIIQPYVFPYIGYFQLLNAVDTFVFYDDVNYMKKGYINRNSILVNGIKHQFTIPCNAISQNKLIHEIQLDFDVKAKTNFLKSIRLAYSKAPFFNIVFPLIQSFIENDRSKSISGFAIGSVKFISDYLSLDKKWIISSIEHSDSKGIDKTDRLIQISKKENADVYFNSIGGKTLYNKSDFSSQGIELKFIQSNPIEYKQFNTEFVPWLSIIDVMMFNSKEQIQHMLNKYTLL